MYTGPIKRPGTPCASSDGGGRVARVPIVYGAQESPAISEFGIRLESTRELLPALREVELSRSAPTKEGRENPMSDVQIRPA